MEEKKVKMYFKGGSGIKDPVDFNGESIKEGDILSPDSFDTPDSFYSTHYPSWTKEDIEAYKHKAVYVVKYNKEKEFYFAEGISQQLYLHDFRFKFTKIIKQFTS
jgi:hypothetical protein